MPSRSPRLHFPRHVVTTVVVVHDGAGWLPGCLEAVRAQRRRPQRLVVVDTGSTDGSADIARGAGEEIEVVRLPRDTGFPAAVGAGVAAADALPAARPRGGAIRWVWVLHDDCRPEPEALLELLTEVDRSPSATVLGCKQLDGAGRHLREVGLTVDGTGRRRSDIDPHEVDQGQYDDVRDVLAVSTAGLLVRRDVWDALGGLADDLPLYGDDVDFGWRANAAGERVVVVPQAVVRHDAAALTGHRSIDAVSGRPEVVRRTHELVVALANTGAALVPWLALRAVAGAAARAASSLSTAHGRPAADELAAVGAVLRHPARVAAARRARRAGRVRSHSDLRPLLARSSVRTRRGIGERLAVLRAGGTEVPRGWRDRPLLWLTLALVALALVADRGLLGGALHGGRLLPAPAGAADLWTAYRQGWHPTGLGSASPAPPWLALLAGLSTLLLGKAWLAVAALMLAAVPLAGLTAYAAASSLTGSRWLRAWAAAGYALLPVATGAVAGGRLDVVVAVILLPLVARALAAAMTAGAAQQVRARAAGAGLVLAVVGAFAPQVWAVVGVAGVAAVLVAVRPLGRGLAALLVALATPVLVLLPWSWHLLAHPSRALGGGGLGDTFALSRSQSVVDLVLLHPGGPAQPVTWLLVGYLLAALAGLGRARGARAARAGFAVLVVGAGAALTLSRLDVTGGEAGARYWTGIPLAVSGLGALVSAVVAADGARAALARHSFGWRQPAALVIAIAAAVATVGSGAWWVGRGADGPLTDRGPQLLPAFAAATVGLPTSPRALVLRADRGQVRYALVREPTGPRLGAADVLGSTAGTTRSADAALSRAVQGVAAGDPQVRPLLTSFGITSVLTRAADAGPLHGLTAVDGLTAAPSSGVVVWRSAAPAGELVVLDPAGSAAVTAGGSLPASTRPAPLPARAGRASTRLPAGADGRLLVLAEPADAHWHATLDGRALPRSTAYGWAQAWRLPARGGRLDVGRGSDGRGWWLLLELAAVVALLAAARPVRRPVGAAP